jgi:hypothetical protein
MTRELGKLAGRGGLGKSVGRSVYAVNSVKPFKDRNWIKRMASF